MKQLELASRSSTTNSTEPIFELLSERFRLQFEIGSLSGVIRDLAIAGRLSPRQSDERQVETVCGTRTATRSREVVLPAVDSSEMRSDVPIGWRWLRLNDTGEYINGLPFKPGDWGSEGYPIIRIQNLSDAAKAIHRTRREVEDAYIVRPGDVLVSWSATLDAYIWNREPGVLNQHIFRVLPRESVVRRPFLYLLLKTTIRLMAASDDAHGLVMKHINRGPFLRFPVAIPPLKEQDRLVDKVSSMATICQSLEVKEKAARDLGSRLTKASLEALTTAETPEEFALAWKRVSDNFETIVDRSEKVEDLRKAIREAGLRGVLTTVRSRRRSGTLGEFCQISGGLQKTPKRTPREHFFPYLRVENVQRGRLALGRIEYFELSAAELEKLRLVKGDILVVEGNGSPSEIGRCAMWNDEIPNCVHQNHLIRCRALADVHPEYLMLALNAPSGTAQMRSLAITTSGLFTLSVSKLKTIQMEIPDIEEQFEIVRRVRKLESMCELLEIKLKASEELAAKFAESVVRGVTA